MDASSTLNRRRGSGSGRPVLRQDRFMTTALPKAFISYRRSDSLSATGRLYDRLNVAYPGMFFRDVSGIGVGSISPRKSSAPCRRAWC